MQTARSNYRILLVDDEIKVLMALRRSLAQIDHTLDITVAKSGEEAIVASDKEEFDLVISDLRMPQISGLKFLSQIRRYQPKTLRVVLSGQTSIEKLLEVLPVSLRAPLLDVQEHYSYDLFSEIKQEKKATTVLLFKVSESLYAIESRFVSCICQSEVAVQLPFIKSRYCVGFVPHNGAALPITDISLLLGYERSVTETSSDRLLIIDFNGLLTGIRVNKVIGIKWLSVNLAQMRTLDRLTISEVEIDNSPVAILSVEDLTNSLMESRR